MEATSKSLLLRRTWWERDAACKDIDDPEIFFEVENAADDGRVPDPIVIATALRLCAKCPINERCFVESVYTRSVGIWGGMTSAERHVRYPVRKESR